jgi:hypothetical protein
VVSKVQESCGSHRKRVICGKSKQYITVRATRVQKSSVDQNTAAIKVHKYMIREYNTSFSSRVQDSRQTEHKKQRLTEY